MNVAGIDFSTRAIDVVLLHDTGRLEWHRFPLAGQDAWERTRQVPLAMPAPTSQLWDETIGFALEDPRGHNAGALFRVQGAVLARLPAATLTNPYIPSRWRYLNGLSGHASKDEIRARSLQLGAPEWPVQDAHDAHLLARAIQADLDAQRKAA